MCMVCAGFGQRANPFRLCISCSVGFSVCPIGDVHLATLLLSKSADVDALDEHQQTPLFAAAALTPYAAHYADPLAMVALLLKP